MMNENFVGESAPEMVVPSINVQRDRFPYCLVWTSIPMLTWFLPIFGHLGICDSHGVIYDFAGPYTVSVDNFAFGRPFKFRCLLTNAEMLEPSAARRWDRGIRRAAEKYSKQDVRVVPGVHSNLSQYSLFFNNCHSFVAQCLRYMKFHDRRDWTMIDTWIMILQNPTYISRLKWWRTYGYLPCFGLSFALFSTIVGLLASKR